MTVRWSRMVALLAGVTAPVAAQPASATLDLSLARMRFADSIDASAISIAPAFSVARDRFSIDATAALSRLQGAWSNSAGFDVTGVLARWNRVALEATGLAGGSAHTGGTRTGQFLGGARVRVALPHGSVWVRGGAGMTWDAQWRSLRRIDVGAWRSVGSSAFAVNALPTIADDTIRFTDTFFSLSHVTGPWNVGASLGFRSGAQLP